MKYRLLTLPILLLLLLMGCTKEDQSICVTPITFHCYFDFNNQNIDQFSKLVNKVDLYIFDQSGLLVRHVSETKDLLPPDYRITVSDMPKGVYSAVLYGTVSGNDGVTIGAKQGDLNTVLLPMQEGQSRITDLRMMLNSISGQTDKDLNTVLHGIVPSFDVTNEPKTHPVSFIRDTHTVNLKIEGLEYLATKRSPSIPSEDVSLRIEANNKAFLYDNTIDMELGQVVYSPFSQSYTEEVLTAELSVLRLLKEYPFTLKIHEGNKLIWQMNLTAEILKSPDYTTNEDLDREDTFIVRIKVTTAGDITVIVNGWTTTTAGEIIG